MTADCDKNQATHSSRNTFFLRATLTALFSMCLVLGWLSQLAAGQETGAETWKGTLDAGGNQLRLVIEIKRTGKEQISGQLTSLDQNNAKLEISDIQLTSSELAFSIPRIGARFSGQLSTDRTIAKGTFSQSGNQLPLTLTKATSKADATEQKPEEKLKQAWVGELNMGVIKPIMQFRIVSLESGETSAYFDSVTEGQTGFPATWSIEDGKLNFDVARIKLKYRGTLNESGDTAEGTWSQGGRNVPLTLKRQQTEYRSPNKWENRPQRPVGPFPYDAIDVTIENKQDKLTLAGTLTVPKRPGRHPAVILISGSGAQDRDESIMEHKPFLVLADYLSRRGIAVLRYDDRGTAESTGKFGSATTEDFARDAASAVEFLKSHDRINPEQIGLAGHSEGGLIAPMVCGLRDDVAFVCLLAATGVGGIEINQSQTAAMLRAEGTDEAEIKLALAINQAAIGVALNSEKGSDLSEELDKALEPIIQSLPESERQETGKAIRSGVAGNIGRLQGNWMRFFLQYDPRPALRKLKCPVLAVIGSKDLQVLPDLNMPEIKKALTEAGNPDFELVELDGLNHLFQKCETGSMNEYITIQETFNPAALKTIGDWITNHTTIVK